MRATGQAMDRFNFLSCSYGVSASAAQNKFVLLYTNEGNYAAAETTQCFLLDDLTDTMDQTYSI